MLSFLLLVSEAKFYLSSWLLLFLFLFLIFESVGIIFKALSSKTKVCVCFLFLLVDFSLGPYLAVLRGESWRGEPGRVVRSLLPGGTQRSCGLESKHRLSA